MFGGHVYDRGSHGWYLLDQLDTYLIRRSMLSPTERTSWLPILAACIAGTIVGVIGYYALQSEDKPLLETTEKLPKKKKNRELSNELKNIGMTF